MNNYSDSIFDEVYDDAQDDLDFTYGLGKDEEDDDMKWNSRYNNIKDYKSDEDFDDDDLDDNDFGDDWDPDDFEDDDDDDDDDF